MKHLLLFFILLLVPMTGCQAVSAAASFLLPDTPTISAEANIGDNSVNTEVQKTKQEAVSIDKIDGENVIINSEVTQASVTKSTSLDNAHANQIIQNNSINPFLWILIGLLIDLNALIKSIKSIFVRG
ncbi:hypothetical protein [Moritella viscosa]|uniref:hypothetical protein n=1 Tax=Moritella viscosa TaxID=80854 RepID=UPI000918B8A5|nr:hypothetical protein [Moritella viscosa]SGZ09770.1 ATP-dependent transcriptional regulator, MalT-like, LuxR family [Moritella viscosa]